MKIYKLLFCKEEGGNMKGFKKGIALIAVLAFLITAILPVAGLAGASNEKEASITDTEETISVSTDTQDVEVAGVNLPDPSDVTTVTYAITAGAAPTGVTNPTGNEAPTIEASAIAWESDTALTVTVPATTDTNAGTWEYTLSATDSNTTDGWTVTSGKLTLTILGENEASITDTEETISVSTDTQDVEVAGVNLPDPSTVTTVTYAITAGAAPTGVTNPAGNEAPTIDASAIAWEGATALTVTVPATTDTNVGTWEYTLSGSDSATTNGWTITSGKLTLTVEAARPAITLSESALLLGVTESNTATVTATVENADAADVQWTIDDDEVATITAASTRAEGTATGASITVTAVAEGETKITATIGSGDNAASDECTVKVSAGPAISLDPTTATVKAGQTVTITPTVVNSTAAVTWTSSNSAVATVDANGVVTGVSASAAPVTITATLGTGAGAPTATCEVTVEELPSVGDIIDDLGEGSAINTPDPAERDENQSPSDVLDSDNVPAGLTPGSNGSAVITAPGLENPIEIPADADITVQPISPSEETVTPETDADGDPEPLSFEIFTPEELLDLATNNATVVFVAQVKVSPFTPDGSDEAAIQANQMDEDGNLEQSIPYIVGLYDYTAYIIESNGDVTILPTKIPQAATAPAAFWNGLTKLTEATAPQARVGEQIEIPVGASYSFDAGWETNAYSPFVNQNTSSEKPQPEQARARSIVYVWSMTSSEQNSSAGLRVNGQTAPTTQTGNGSYQATVTGIQVGEELTVTATPYAPADGSTTQNPVADTTKPFNDGKGVVTFTLVGRAPYITGITNTTPTLSVPNNEYYGRDGIIYGQIGVPLSQDVTINWWGPGADRYSFRPMNNGPNGPALTVTPNPRNPQKLTLSTGSVPLNVEPGWYQYEVCTVGSDGTEYPTGQILRLYAYILKPTINSQAVQAAPTLPFIAGADVYAVKDQTRNLPVLQVNASMDGGSENGWADTVWYAVGSNDSFNIANPDPKYRLTNGGSQSGNLTATYQVQPEDVDEGWTMQTDLVQPQNLTFYAVVQYGSNPDCVAYAAKFTLHVVERGALLPMQNGQPVGIENLSISSSNSLQGPGTAATVSALTTSKTPVTLTAMWIPDVVPSGVASYRWTYTNGAGSFKSGGTTYTVGDGKTLTTSSPTLTVSEFNNSSRWVFSCQPLDASGNPILSIAPAVFNLNVGDVNVGTASEQAQAFSYWVQPANGYFTDTAESPNVQPDAIPTGTLGQYGNLLSIGNIGSAQNVTGVTPEGGVVPVALNGRFQLYFDPSQIQYGIDTASGLPHYLTRENWSDYVTLEWRYKPSQYTEDDANGMTIDRGLGFIGVNSPLLTSGPLTAAMDGWEFGLEIHSKADPNVYVATRWALLDLDGISPATQPTAQITSFPASAGTSVNLTTGSEVTFTASAQESIPAENLAYRWESRPAVSAANPDPSWSPISGATEAQYTLTNLRDSQNGTSYRCIVINTAYATGVEQASNILTLNISPANGSIVISAPTEAVLLNYYASRTLTTSVTATTDNGDPVVYQWFQKNWPGQVPVGDAVITTPAQAAAEIAASGSSLLTGETNATLTTQPLTEGVYEFTCHITNANDPTKVMNSQPVYVVVTENSRKPYVYTPASAPSGQITSMGVVNGQPVTFTCDAWVASGEELTYQWETSQSPNGPWTTMTNATSASFTMPNVTQQYTGTYFHCIATNAAAKESTTSNPYLLNVWNTANTPVIINPPQNVEITWDSEATEISMSCTARVSQGALHEHMIPMWSLPNNNGTRTPADNNLDGTGIQVSNVNNGDGTFTSVITIPVATEAEARSYTGSYTCTWFNNQDMNSDSLGTHEGNQISPAQTDVLLAPQATSGKAEVTVGVTGTPKIIAKTESPVTKAVGETASFNVTALLNEASNTVPAGQLVYVWQMTDDGGATWRNCLSSDGTGQFTDTFTTAAITQTMYDNSTASNVAGAGNGSDGIIGNANTVYMYRVVVGNRTTGAKEKSGAFKLIITATASEPPVVEEPTLESAGNITIEGTAPNRYATGITVSAAGTTVDEFLEGYGWQAPAGYSLQIVGSNGTKLDGGDRVYTGCVLQLVKDETGDVVDSATIIVRGDVLGANNSGTVGTLAINQLVRMAQDLNETRPLDGIYEMAGDFNGNSSIDIADLVAEAQLLSLHEPVQK